MFFSTNRDKQKKTMNIHSFDKKKFYVFSMFFLCFFIVLHKHRMYATRHPTFVNIDISLFFLCFFYVLIFDQNYVFSTNRDKKKKTMNIHSFDLKKFLCFFYVFFMFFLCLHI